MIPIRLFSRHAAVGGMLALLVPAAALAQTALYTPPPNNPFISQAGESIVSLSVTSGSLQDAQTQLDNARAANPNAIVILNLTGAYSVTSSPLVLPSDTCLVFQSGAQLVAGPSASAPCLIQIAGDTDVSVSGGTLNGGGGSLTGIAVTTSSRVNIDDVAVSGCGAAGISLSGNGNTVFDNELTVTRCAVTGCGAGIAIANSTQTLCTDNSCANNAGAGIAVGGAYAGVANNTCSSNGTGIAVTGTYNDVTDNQVQGNGTGISLSGSSDNLITSNAITGSTTLGVSAGGTGDTLADNTFSGNANDLSAAGTGNNIVARLSPLNAPNQNYFYPPLIDDPQTGAIVNGLGRVDLTIGDDTLSDVESQYSAAVSANPGSVVVLHLTGDSYTGDATVTLQSNTCVLLSGTITLDSGVTAFSANNGTVNLSFSGGTIDGGGSSNQYAFNLTGCKMVQIDSVTMQNFGPTNPRSGVGAVVHFSNLSATPGGTPLIVTRSTINTAGGRGFWIQAENHAQAIFSRNTSENVNEDGIDLDSGTSNALVKFNNCSNNVRDGVFVEQSDNYDLLIGNTFDGNSRAGFSFWNNGVSSNQAPTEYNTAACNILNANDSIGLEVGSQSGSAYEEYTAHNFAFNNQITNTAEYGIQGTNIGQGENGAANSVQNYFSQNIVSGSGREDLDLSGHEVFFNPTVPPSGTVYSIQATAGANGSISPSGTLIVAQGASPTFTVSPANGFTVSAVTVDGASVGAVTSYTFPNVQANHTISAAFQPSPVSAPVFSPAPGTYSSAQNVTIAAAGSTMIYYTTDGSAPTTSSPVYTGPIAISATTILRAFGANTEYTGPVANGVYNFAAPAPTYTYSAETLPYSINPGPNNVSPSYSSASDSSAPGGSLIYLTPDASPYGPGQSITFTTPAMNAGTYQFKYGYKAYHPRGQLTVSVDGTQVGGTIDQYASSTSYPTTTLGTVTFSTSSTHTITLTVVGKNSADTTSPYYTIDAAQFQFVGQAAQSPVITWAAPADIVYGTPLGAAQLDATANVPGTFAYTPGAGTVLNGGAAQLLTVVFTPNDTVDYSSATAVTTINVDPAPAQIAWPTPSDITYGTALGSGQLDATANVPGTFTYTPAAGTVLNAGSNQTLTVVFTPGDTVDYATTTATTTLNVDPAPVQVALSSNGETYDGSGEDAAATTSVAGLPLLWTYNGLPLAFTPSDDTLDAYTGAAGQTLYLIVTGAAGGTVSGSGFGPYTVGSDLGTAAYTAGLLQVGQTAVVEVTLSADGTTFTFAPSLPAGGYTTGPVSAGTYTVTATVANPNYTGSFTGTWTIAQANPAGIITVTPYTVFYDGDAHTATASATSVTGENISGDIAVAGTTHTYPGTYADTWTFHDPQGNYADASGTVTDVIDITALVSQGITLNGQIDGSAQVLGSQSDTLNGNAMISGDLLVPGTPRVVLNGKPTYAGTVAGPGDPSPSGYSVVLNGNAVLRHVVTQIDPIAMPQVAAPPAPTGTRTVSINGAGQSAGNFATVCNLTVNGNAGQIAVPPGTYGNFTANGQSGFTFGVAGATEPAVYNFQSLTLNGGGQIQVVGPVIITVATGPSLNGQVGSSANPDWVTLQVHSGGLTLNGNVTFDGEVLAPAGTVTINGNSVLNGWVSCNQLVINGDGLLNQAGP